LKRPAFERKIVESELALSVAALPRRIAFAVKTLFRGEPGAVVRKCDASAEYEVGLATQISGPLDFF